MRERLIGILVVLIVGVVVLYAVPRAYFTADLVRDHEVEMLERTADVLQARVDLQLATGAPVDASALETGLDRAGKTDGVRYTAGDGTTVEAGRFDDATSRSLVDTRPTSDGGTLTVTRDRAIVTTEVERALLPLIVLGVLLAAMACVIAYVVAGRMSRPFHQLAVAAGELGRGNFRLDLPQRGVPEAMEIGNALATSASRLDELVRRERELAVHASHELRTPVTALRLELEDLTFWPETSPEVADQLRRSIGEIDRLTDSIDQILDLARRQRHGDQVDLDLADFVADTVERWQGRVCSEQRTITAQDSGPVSAVISVTAVAQVLDVLIDNALLHGTGTITVSAREVASGVEVRVSDDGTRAFGSEVLRRSGSTGGGGVAAGVGLGVATELAEAAGGRLAVDETSATTSFVLLLPSGRTSV